MGYKNVNNIYQHFEASIKIREDKSNRIEDSLGEEDIEMYQKAN